MGYTITITQTKEQQKEETGSYCQIGIIYISAEEYVELTYEDRKRYELQADGKWAKALYDYPPKRLVVKTESVKVFEQTVDALDIKSVIRAVNAGPEIPYLVADKQS